MVLLRLLQDCNLLNALIDTISQLAFNEDTHLQSVYNETDCWKNYSSFYKKQKGRACKFVKTAK